MISIVVNEKRMGIEENSNVIHLLNHLKATQDGIAVAINSMVISKDFWKYEILFENDVVLIIKATQGG
ncbi:sulfur carrier protein ThiS [Cellulophaga sp. E16_2]|uniref:Thiamine biosynthesis protein ThiS n=1 Tax=Cellulophaga algicola (strain DSM 14237 / IC166 / ACAM 630) TaxID=688270 RepID=E6XB95_CELAD|nr:MULTISPECIES: sulfur carrier protein ThiS [Cellulophaga]ADV49959.1 thiamine biosynthesis protein ThiS [Cellulophaga algicola DSM 14237]MBO0592333.1 sulfur carrier protein ThiS [Cellulophaga sp. E16_2]